MLHFVPSIWLLSFHVFAYTKFMICLYQSMNNYMKCIVQDVMYVDPYTIDNVMHPVNWPPASLHL